MACPLPEFTDRGKSSVIIGGGDEAIEPEEGEDEGTDFLQNEDPDEAV
jgi:hypothetical protein